MHTLFSFSGRVNRLRFALITIFFVPLTLVIISPWMGLSLMAQYVGGTQAFLYALLISLLAIPTGWISAAQIVKRLHDLDKPAGWALLALIPGVNALGWVYLMAAPGVHGDNRFGIDPLAWQRVIQAQLR